MSELLSAGGVYFPALAINEHSHRSWELNYCTGGTGCIHIGEASYSIQPGDIILIPPETAHFFSSPLGFTHVYLLFGDSREIQRCAGVLKISDTPERDIYGLMAMLARQHTLNDPSRGEFTERLSDALFSLILSIKGTLQSPHYIEQIKAILTKNIGNSAFNLDDIYTVAPELNKDYVRRVFKRETGVTPNTFLNNLRISNAKALLDRKEAYLSIKTVAQMCGFSDQYYFSRMFRREVGMSPIEWKNR